MRGVWVCGVCVVCGGVGGWGVGVGVEGMGVGGKVGGGDGGGDVEAGGRTYTSIFPEIQSTLVWRLWQHIHISVHQYYYLRQSPGSWEQIKLIM